MKYFIGKITEHYDGLEFDSTVLLKARTEESAGKKIDKAAKQWRDDDTIIFEGSFSSQLTKEEFNIMAKYIHVIN